jgi:hypothetical protein
MHVITNQLMLRRYDAMEYSRWLGKKRSLNVRFPHFPYSPNTMGIPSIDLSLPLSSQHCISIHFQTHTTMFLF